MVPAELSADERKAIAGGRWFGTLPPTVRHDLLRSLRVRRYADGDVICRRGERADAWLACAGGAVRIRAGTADGRTSTLTLVAAGRWFGDPPLSEQDVRTHDAHAHEAASVASVRRVDLQRILELHPALYPALMRLQALRLRQVFHALEDVSSLGLRARLGRQLLLLSRTHGVASRAGEVRIAVPLRQDVLAEMVGCSRQRVNEQLGELVRARVIRKEAGRLVVRDRGLLQRWGEASSP